MRRSRIFSLGIALLMMGSATSQARTSYGYSEIFSIDTMTAIGDEASGLPQTSKLTSIYPNPFNPSTTIAFDLASGGITELAIFDLRGRLVRVVESGPRTAGRHQVIWDGFDRDGRGVPSGTYFCRMATGEITQSPRYTVVST